ncbi:MAG: sulfite exporter TauE/SafE family protein [Planctomycetes bacterium]|nr:sulfite exporter TauE/SafE family protein [Planctomycetota bacterium]
MRDANPILFDLIIIAVSALSGCFGSMLGLGGGAILIPVLVTGMGVDVKSAIAASLVAVVTTSGAAALIRGRNSMSNYRVGITLEVVAGLGAIVGAGLATIAPGDLLTMLFGVSLLVTAAMSWRGVVDPTERLPQSRGSRLLQLDGVEETADGPRIYRVQRVPAGLGVMTIAGILSGMLGIGSGAFKVAAMDTCMRMPFRVSTITSNFMIGITAASGVMVYLRGGKIDPTIAGPVLIGIVPGAMLGSWLVPRIKVGLLKKIFLIVIILIGLQMMFRGGMELLK